MSACAAISAHSGSGNIDTNAALGTRTMHQQADQNVHGSIVRSRSYPANACPPSSGRIRTERRRYRGRRRSGRAAGGPSSPPQAQPFERIFEG